MKKGFTLLELLTVMTIGIILMSMSMAAYYGMIRTSALSGAVTSVRTVLSLARQTAISNRRRVYVIVENDSSNSGRGRLCMAEHLGVNTGGTTLKEFKASAKLAAKGGYVGSRVFNIDSGNVGIVTNSINEYIYAEMSDGSDLEWIAGDRCAILLHDWVSMPEGIMFTNIITSELLMFKQDGMTPVWDKIPGEFFVVEMVEMGGKLKGFAKVGVRKLNGQVEVLDGVVN